MRLPTSASKASAAAKTEGQQSYADTTFTELQELIGNVVSRGSGGTVLDLSEQRAVFGLGAAAADDAVAQCRSAHVCLSSLSVRLA